MKMPKVLRIINRFNLGGPTYNVAYLSKYMFPEYETLLVGGENGNGEASSDYIVNKLGVKTLKIPEMEREINGYNDIVSYYKLKHIIKKYKPDIVHTHASKAGFLGRHAAKNCNVPVILHTFHGHIFHSYFNKTKTEFFKLLERKLAESSNKIIAISQAQKEELCNIHQIADEDKVEVIPLGFDLERFQTDYDNKRHSFRDEYSINGHVVISIIGRLVSVKNHKLFINAIHKVKNNSTCKIKAMIVGDGDLRPALIQLAESLGLSCSAPEKPNNNADIVFTSWIENADTVFAGSDITALTSYNEGTPVSLIESQAANTPIISTDVGGIKDVVMNGKTALLAENDNLEDFSQKLLELVENEKLRKAMSLNGYDFVKEKFHYKRLVNDMKNLYDKLLQNN